MTLDALLEEVLHELCAARFGDVEFCHIAAAVVAAATDSARADVIAEHSDEIPCTGDLYRLRLAFSWVGAAISRRASGDVRSAAWWLEKAESELESYRRPTSDVSHLEGT